ncbi:MAG: hypothetical protein B6I37_05245 [Desulfobacteraceae bacterium 4572_35.2]|nr:MAG: hypothetical protein B6I37_05245 [Desulfobacteraceae bacterium 4572_35.2]
MESISAEKYNQLIRSSTILEKDGHGEKVLLTAEGDIVKIFRRKRLLSSALLFPYASRFVNNARRLQRLNVPTVSDLRLGHCCDPVRDLVWYRPLPGITLRQYCMKDGSESIMDILAKFVASLHSKGVLFRSLHWGNIIVMEDLSLGLIDIADMRFYRRSLTVAERVRNFRHMLRYNDDQRFFNSMAEPFWAHYQDASKLSDTTSQKIKKLLSNHEAQVL